MLEKFVVDKGTSSLGHILASLGFSQKQQRGIVALLIRSFCFSDNYDGFIWDENSLRREKQESDVQTVKRILSEHSSIFKPWQAIKKPSDQEIIDILNHSLPMNDKALLQFLVTLTQLRLLGRYSEQGLHNHSEIQEYRAVEKEEDDDIVRSLELDQEAVWPEGPNKITNVFLHAATGIAIRARLIHLFRNLQQHSGEKVYIYYATNPRGVFPFESSLAWILAKRILSANPHLHLLGISFSKMEAVIQLALKNLTDKKINWTTIPDGISQSVQSILQYLHETFNGEILWPTVQESDYEPIYNECARLEGREEFRLYWPTGIELLQHLINILSKDYGLDPKSLIIVPHLVSGTINAAGKYCPATTSVLLKDFIQKYGNEFSQETIFAVVTDNSATSNAMRQDFETRLVFEGKLKYVLLHDAFDRKNFSPFQAYPSIAKLLYALNDANPFCDENLAILKKGKSQELMATHQSESSAATTQRSLSPVAEASSNRYAAFPKPPVKVCADSQPKEEEPIRSPSPTNG